MDERRHGSLSPSCVSLQSLGEADARQLQKQTSRSLLAAETRTVAASSSARVRAPNWESPSSLSGTLPIITGKWSSICAWTASFHRLAEKLSDQALAKVVQPSAPDRLV